MNHWLEHIYREHRRGLFALAMSVVHEAATAEDAVHEAFARLIKLPGPPDGDAGAYVYRAVRNAAIDQIRKRGSRAEQVVVAESIFVTPSDEDPAVRAESQEMKLMLMKLIDDLPDAEREVIVLRSLAGLSFKEVADVVDRPVSTIASRYRKALDTVKRQMEAAHART